MTKDAERMRRKRAAMSVEERRQQWREHTWRKRQMDRARARERLRDVSEVAAILDAWRRA